MCSKGKECKMQRFSTGLIRLWVKFRFKVFRLLSIILLGREGAQSVVGLSVFFDLEFANSKDVRNRIVDRKLLSEATVQTYNCAKVPECWRVMFSRRTAFPRRFAYVLKDVEIGADSGVIHIRPVRAFSDDGTVFIQSAGSINFPFQWGIQEVMRKARPIQENVPICPMPTIGYYHDIFEGLLRVVKARKVFMDIKVLVSKNHPRYIDEMLDLIGVQKDQIIVSDSPVRVKRGILIPRWIDSGENLKEDVCELRRVLTAGLPNGNPCEAKRMKLYISRRKSRRPLPNEREVEMFFENRGFTIAYFEDIPLLEQLKTIRSSEIIVAPHGAALSNLVVAMPHIKVFEIMTQDYANSCYGHIASSLEIDYTCIDADSSDFFAQLEQLFL